MSIIIERRRLPGSSADTSWLEAGDGGKPPVIFIHGTSSDAQLGWADAFQRLASRYHCLAPDLIGSGETRFHGDQPTFDDLLAQIEALANTLEGHFDLVGYSLGGVLATAAAARFGSRVRKLVTFGGWAYSDRPMRLLFSLWAELADRDRRQLAELVLYNGASTAYLRALPEDFIALLLERYETLLAPGSAGQARVDATVDIRALLGAVTADTLVIGMKQDGMVPAVYCRELADGIAGARYQEVESGHLVMMENPEVILAAIEAHLG